MWDDLMKIGLRLFDSSTVSSDHSMDFLSHHTTFAHCARFRFFTPSHHFPLAIIFHCRGMNPLPWKIGLFWLSDFESCGHRLSALSADFSLLARFLGDCHDSA
jgi:hypothetical protein